MTDQAHTARPLDDDERERIVQAIKALPNDWGFWHAAFQDAQSKAIRIVREGVPDAE